MQLEKPPDGKTSFAHARRRGPAAKGRQHRRDLRRASNGGDGTDGWRSGVPSVPNVLWVEVALRCPQSHQQPLGGNGSQVSSVSFGWRWHSGVPCPQSPWVEMALRCPQCPQHPVGGGGPQMSPVSPNHRRWHSGVPSVPKVHGWEMALRCPQCPLGGGGTRGSPVSSMSIGGKWRSGVPNVPNGPWVEVAPRCPRCPQCPSAPPLSPMSPTSLESLTSLRPSVSPMSPHPSELQWGGQ